MKISTFIKSVAIGSSLLASSFAFAASHSINAGENDLAIDGYDPVAYFTQHKPVKGSSKFTAVHDGVIYQFSSANHRNEFKANPEKFAPQFGGFCAMGVALNKKLDTDPTAWHIEDGKLYLNLNANVQKKWMTDVPGYLDTADRVWNGIEDVSAEEVNAD